MPDIKFKIVKKYSSNLAWSNDYFKYGYPNSRKIINQMEFIIDDGEYEDDNSYEIQASIKNSLLRCTLTVKSRRVPRSSDLSKYELIVSCTIHFLYKTYENRDKNEEYPLAERKVNDFFERLDSLEKQE